MDPQVVLYALLDAYERNDRVAVNEHLENLTEWNLKGGFLPTIDRPSNQSVSHFVVRRVIAEDGPAVQDFQPHYIHEAVEVWCEEDGRATAREAWESAPARPVELSPGDHVLLPSDWLDEDSAYEGELTEVAVVQREFEAGDGEYIVSPLFDDYREVKLSANVLHWGRIQWLAWC